VRNQPFSQLTDEWADSHQSRGQSRRRPWLLAVIIIAFQIPIVCRLVYVQAFIGERFIAPWRIPLEEREVIPARDGRILSRDGVVLAQDLAQYDLAVDYRWLERPANPLWLKRMVNRELNSEQRKDPLAREQVEQRLQQHRETLLSNLSELTGESVEEMAGRMAGIQRRIEAMKESVDRRRQARADEQQSDFDWSQGLTGISRLVVDELTRPPDRFVDDPLILKEELQSHDVLTNVPLQVAATVQSQPERFRGVSIRSSSFRSYPQQDLAAHVIGIRRKGSSTSGGAEAGRVGESGVERLQQPRLAGIPGERKKTRDRHGDLISSEVLTAPTDGQDVTLTFDSRLQRLAEELLDRAVFPPPRSLSSETPIPRGACLIAMDVWTGDLLVLASSPRVSLNTLIRPTAEQWRQIQNDPGQPLFSRGTQMALPPGSLFQVVTAMAALESGAVTADEILHCQGYLDTPDQYRCSLFRRQGIGHGQLTLQEALGQSCQVCFYSLARRLGPDPLLQWSARAGLGGVTGIDLPGEVAGKLPPWNQLRTAQGKPTSGVLQFAVGQGALLVSPLQVARLFAAIANGGRLVTPHVTQEQPGAEPSPLHSPIVRLPGLSPATIETIRRGLEQGVGDPRGASHAAHVEMLEMAVASGSGSVAGKPDHAWVAGYAPARQPRVAVVLVLEHGGSAEAALPLFREFITELLGIGVFRPANPSVTD